VILSPGQELNLVYNDTGGARRDGLTTVSQSAALKLQYNAAILNDDV